MPPVILGLRSRTGVATQACRLHPALKDSCVPFRLGGGCQNSLGWDHDRKIEEPETPTWPVKSSLVWPRHLGSLGTCWRLRVCGPRNDGSGRARKQRCGLKIRSGFRLRPQHLHSCRAFPGPSQVLWAISSVPICIWWAGGHIDFFAEF